MTTVDLPWARMKQPDQTTCGPSSVVAARMMLDPSFADAVRGSETVFGAAALTTHRRATRAVDVAGRLQLPWPRRFGTPPWAVARELSAARGPDLPPRPYSWSLSLLRPGRGFDRAAAGLDEGRPVALYVGNRWLPRHVVLAVARAGDDSLWVYDPARARRVQVDRAAVAARELTFGRWDRIWFVVSPRPPARRTPA